MIKKIIAYFLLAMCMIVVLSACNEGGSDTANDTKTAVYYDDSQIIQDGDNLAFDEYGSEVVDSGNKLILSGFNGAKNIYKLTAKEDGTVSFYYDLKTSKGVFKCVYINVDKEIEVITEKGSSDIIDLSDTITLNVPKGESSIKIVGLDSDIELITKVQNSDGNVQVDHIN